MLNANVIKTRFKTPYYLYSPVLLGFALLFNTSIFAADTYFGVGTSNTEFASTLVSYDYESDVNQLQEFKFGYSDKDTFEFFTNIEVDEDNKLRDYALGLVLEDSMVYLERGKISGDLTGGFSLDRKFDGDFTRLYLLWDLLPEVADAPLLGIAYQNHTQPETFGFYNGSDFPTYGIDNELEVTSLGFAIYWDGIYNKLKENISGAEIDWYGRVSSAVLSVSQIKSSDNLTSGQYSYKNKTWYLPASIGHYELGVLAATNISGIKVVANAGYQIRASYAVDMANGLGLSDPEIGEIEDCGTMLVMTGFTASINVSF